LDLKPQDIEVDIIYEDSDIAVINKPQGMVVHPAPGNRTDTLVNALLTKLDNLSGINGQLRPGIVHRLDKDTSGLLVIAKNDFAHLRLAEQIKDRSAKRTYLTIVHNVLKQDSGYVNAPIGRHPLHRKKMAITDSRGSREALTRFNVLERFLNFTYLEVKLETGRTHQIRVHMSSIGHPVLGDPVYGPKNNPFGLCMQMLHAAKLSIKHPITKEHMEFRANLPENFEKTLKMLRENNASR
jgi:23S rRNA pseudouridine1911/1915/1917 synthase